MDFTQDWMRVAMAITGALSIYLGYSLFCNTSHQDSRTTWSGLLKTLLAGALLAVFGLGILIAEVRAMRASERPAHAASHQRKSTEQGSFPTPWHARRTNIVERTI